MASGPQVPLKFAFYMLLSVRRSPDISPKLKPKPSSRPKPEPKSKLRPKPDLEPNTRFAWALPPTLLTVFLLTFGFGLMFRF